MTRANLNFVGSDVILFHYHNGDQYPEGLVGYFGVGDFCRIDRLWQPEDFKEWIRKNYTKSARRVTTFSNGTAIDTHVQTDDPAEAEEVGQPCIYYTGTVPTDYSYVFTGSMQHGRKRKDGSRSYRWVNYMYVYNWSRLIFQGTPQRFLAWAEKRRYTRPGGILPPDQSAKATVERTLLQAVTQTNTK